MARAASKVEVIDRDKERLERRSVDDHRGTTPERVQKAAGAFTIGDDKQGGKTWTMMDSPLERLFAQDRLSKSEYDGLVKYRIHWFRAGLQPSLGSVDLNRIFASDPSNFSGMAKSEAQVFHRQKWREACDLLGHRATIVIDNVVCAEQSALSAGICIGWNNRPQAEAAAITVLRDAGYRLARHWGLM